MTEIDLEEVPEEFVDEMRGLVDQRIELCDKLSKRWKGFDEYVEKTKLEINQIAEELVACNDKIQSRMAQILGDQND